MEPRIRYLIEKAESLLIYTDIGLGLACMARFGGDLISGSLSIYNSPYGAVAIGGILGGYALFRNQAVIGK
jgi:hypothetical protein